jgi:hypothetical protein
MMFTMGCSQYCILPTFLSSALPRMTLPISDNQSLLATLDPVARLERVDALLDEKAETADP